MKLFGSFGSKPAWFPGLVFLLGLAATGAARAADADALPTVALTFQGTAPTRLRVTRTGETGFLTSATTAGGAITSGAEPTWHVEAAAPFGEGALDCELDRARLAGDLALVLRGDWQGDADLAIQLFDAAGTPLALDLFGNVVRNGPAAATDTFIVPLTRYPQATRLSVRRLSGSLTLRSAGLFPVLSELPSSPEVQRTIAGQLGLVFHPADPAALPTAAAIGPSAASALGTLHAADAPLARVNEVGAAALSRADYPVFRRLTTGPLAPGQMVNSGTTDDFLKAALRSLALQSQSGVARSAFTSSDGVAATLLAGRATLGLMSVPLTSAEKEKFFKNNGYPILEFPVAHDAIEVLVNAANPLTKLTIPQLDAIYSDAPRAGAGQPIRDWRDLGAGSGEIKVFGGAPGWGTAKTLQSLVLQGGAFRRDVTVKDVVFREGVEAAVAHDPAAIGYASLRFRAADVRVLAIAPNSGEEASLPDSAAIYAGRYPLQRAFYGYVARARLEDAAPLERELVNLLLSDVGQALVARSGSLPLSAAEVVEARARLGLPK